MVSHCPVISSPGSWPVSRTGVSPLRGTLWLVSSLGSVGCLKSPFYFHSRHRSYFSWPWVLLKVKEPFALLPGVCLNSHVFIFKEHTQQTANLWRVQGRIPSPISVGPLQEDKGRPRPCLGTSAINQAKNEGSASYLGPSAFTVTQRPGGRISPSGTWHRNLVGPSEPHRPPDSCPTDLSRVCARRQLPVNPSLGR